MKAIPSLIPSLILALALVQVAAAASDRAMNPADRTSDGLQASDWQSIRSAHEAAEDLLPPKFAIASPPIFPTPSIR